MNSIRPNICSHLVSVTLWAIYIVSITKLSHQSFCVFGIIFRSWKSVVHFYSVVESQVTRSIHKLGVTHIPRYIDPVSAMVSIIGVLDPRKRRSETWVVTSLLLVNTSARCMWPSFNRVWSRNFSWNRREENSFRKIFASSSPRDEGQAKYAVLH